MALQHDIDGDYTASAYRDPRRDQENIYVVFKMMTVEDPVRTAAEGRACFKEIEVMEAMQVGSKNAKTVKPVDERIKQRWPRQYAAFKEGQEQPLEGTPLEEWPLMTRSMVEELKYLNVRTVEQLISMPDSAKQQIMGVHDLVRKAKDWLEQSDGSLTQLRDENTKLMNQLEFQQQAIEEMRKELDALKAKPKRTKAQQQIEDAAT